MRVPQTLIAAGIFIAAALATTTSFAGAPKSAPILLTAEQKQVETLARSLLKEPAVQAARAAAIKRYQASPMFELADGKKTLEGATDELLFGVLLKVADDPAQPKIVWTEVLPYTWNKQRLTGSRYAGDSPDRAYRGVTVDPSYRYEIHGKRNGTAPLYISVEAIPPPAFWGLPPLQVITSKDIDFDQEGSFEITVDSSPTNGRRNHLQMPPRTSMLLLRDTIPDWKNQRPNTLTIKRIGDKVKPRSRAEMIAEVPGLLDESVTASLKYFEGIWRRETNQLNVFVRDLGWGVLAVNRFSVPDDEALVMTLDPMSAQYLSIQTMDLWLRSPEYSNRTISMNNTQAKANADGSVTYVLSPKDPGVYNWIDTGGLNDAIMVIRWELLTQQATPDRAVREVKKMKLADLDAALPPEVVRVNAAERKQQLAERQAAYETRLR